MPDVAILAYVSCGNVLVLGTDQPVNWSAFFEIRVRLSAELAIVPRSRFLVRSKMKAFHKCAPVGGHLPYTSGSSLGKRGGMIATMERKWHSCARQHGPDALGNLLYVVKSDQTPQC